MQTKLAPEFIGTRQGEAAEAIADCLAGLSPIAP